MTSLGHWGRQKKLMETLKSLGYVGICGHSPQDSLQGKDLLDAEGLPKPDPGCFFWVCTGLRNFLQLLSE